MTHFLASDDKQDGYKLEDILVILRADIIKRANEIVDDHRVESNAVLENNIKIMVMLSDCIELATESTSILNKSFGPSKEGQHRIG